MLTQRCSQRLAYAAAASGAHKKEKMLDGRDWDAREHEQIAQRQRAFQTGVFLCMMLLMMDVRDPRAVQEEALRRARAEAEEAALRRQAAPT